ncbi:MAG: hypothetical protein JO227_07040 [Acetobacteraceae bacterium]|nr:hypothetical protein [Acetobacteraceae bacterium]
MSTSIACPWPIEELLPHQHPMILLDQVLRYDSGGVTAFVIIRPDHPFAAAEGVPAHVGIELMAQACGAFVGAHARAEGMAPRIGLLLGTRDYRAHAGWFRMGDRLEITAEVLFRDTEMGVFACRVSRGSDTLAEAQLTVCEPADEAALSAVLKGEHV